MKTFPQLFEGFTKKHGRFVQDAVQTEVKIKGQTRRAFGAPSQDDWDKHLDGTGDGLGIVMLRDDGHTVSFGAIDIDVYDLTFEALEEQTSKLPILICKSKSKGAHLYLFCEEPVPATLMRKRLEEWAALLGFGGAEIFPKQIKRIEADDMGNWLNVPYYGETRQCFNKGKLVPVDDFVALANERLVTLEWLEKVSTSPGKDFADGPPCLQFIVGRGLQKGERNTVLFNIGVYMRLKYPETWADHLSKYNHTLDEPLPRTEIEAVIKSLERKDYTFTCKQTPLNGYCNRRECNARDFGLGGFSPDLPIELTELTKVCTDPPTYYVNINGVRVRVPSYAKLISVQNMRIMTGEVADLVLPAIPQKKWDSIIQELLDDVTIQEGADDASDEGLFVHYLAQFIETRGQSTDRDRLLAGSAFTDETHAYFRYADLAEYLHKQGNKITSQEVWAILRSSFNAATGQYNIKGKNCHWWRLDLELLTVQSEDFDVTKTESPF